MDFFASVRMGRYGGMEPQFKTESGGRGMAHQQVRDHQVTIFDDFNDGSLDPAWNGTIFGTAVESGGTLTLSNPGFFGFLPAPLINESSVVSGHGIGANFSGDFTATSRWLQTVPTLSQGMNLAFGSINPGTGNVHQYSVGIGYATAELAAGRGHRVIRA